MTIYARSARDLLTDLAFFLGTLRPSSWRRGYELHERDCALFDNGVCCTCSRAAS